MGRLYYFFSARIGTWIDFVNKVEDALKISKQFSEEELIGNNLGARIDRKQSGTMIISWIFENVTKGYVEKALGEMQSKGFDVIEGNAETRFEPESFNFYFGITKQMEDNPYDLIFGPMLAIMRKWGWLKEN